MQGGMERLDATPEELDSIVEQARPALDEAGYQKLKAAIRTLGAVNTLMQNQDITIESLRNWAWPSWCESLPWSAQDRGSARHLKIGGRLPGLSARQNLPPA
jgi:hypothetical protein